ITARAYGRPHVTIDPFGQSKLSGLADLLDYPESRATDPVTAVEAVRKLLAEGPATTPRTVGIEALIDAHFDRVAELALQRSSTSPVEPPTWADTATPLHLTLRRPPRSVVPAPDSEPACLRRPDITPSLDELRSTVEAALATRTALRDEGDREHCELIRLRDDNRHLRGAIDHLAGVVRHEHELEDVVSELRDQLRAAKHERARLADAVQSARASRIFRLTGRPSALRDAEGR
ncbi:MAG TPA: hypothetical protein VK964_02935, partial [Nocardioidaceae bacterium]|nr:hypothetical protein [Nocardioidaceae bacterium]